MKFFIFVFLIFSMKTFAHHPGHKIEANKPYPSVSLEILEDNMDGYNLYIKLENFVLVLTPEGGTYAVSQFRSGFYYIAKDMNIPYVPIEIDFKNRSFNIQEPHFISGTFEEESLKLEKLFEGVEGATRTFTMLREKE